MVATIAEARFRVMGTDAHLIIVDGASSAAEAAEAQLRTLESHWTRFRDDSELMRVNARPGVPVIVSPDTFDAVRFAVRAWEYTQGTFDPTVYDAMIAEGYDRDFLVLGGTAVAHAPSPGTAPGCGSIHLDPVTRAITIPPGVHLDLGGIGKGLAADLVTRTILAGGAAGACVNLGGDLCALGTPPSEAGWIVELSLPNDAALGGATEIALPGGAVATSSITSRTWDRDGTPTHHLIDPATGKAANSPVQLATVLAEDAWWAETCAKAIIIDGALDLAHRFGNAGLIVRADETVECFGGFEQYLHG